MRSISAIEKYNKLIKNSILFKDLSDSELGRALEIFRAKYSEYGRGDTLHQPYTKMKQFGLVLSGVVQACMDDVEGNRMIMAEVVPGITFGESICFLKTEDSPVYVYASENCGVLWLSPEDLFRGDDDFTIRLQEKFATMLAARTIAMNNRIQVLSKLRLRDKLVTYFSQLSQSAHSHTVLIPMNRDDLATYMGTNRSALSREMARMKNDGLIDYYRNTVRILKKQ